MNSKSSEILITKGNDISRIQGAEMRFLTAVKGCTMRDLIRRELGTAESLNEKISQYKTDWRLHVERMDPVSYTHLDVYKRQLYV